MSLIKPPVPQASAEFMAEVQLSEPSVFRQVADTVNATRTAAGKLLGLPIAMGLGAAELGTTAALNILGTPITLGYKVPAAISRIRVGIDRALSGKKAGEQHQQQAA